MKLNKPIHELTGSDLVDLAKSLDRETWIKVGAVAVAASLVIYFFVMPAWFKRAELKTQIASVEGQIIRLQTLRRNERGWRDDKKVYREFIGAVKERLFLPGETSLLLGRVSQLAKQSNVSVIASTPRGESVDIPDPFNKSYRAELYDFTLEGGYHELAEFISKIESNEKILRVEHFQISPREESPRKHLADVTLSAVSLREA